MNRFIIQKYISRLTKDDIIQYAKRQGFFISDDDVQVIYYYIKEKSSYFFSGHQEEIFQEIKDKVSSSTFQKIMELYDVYKNKI